MDAVSVVSTGGLRRAPETQCSFQGVFLSLCGDYPFCFLIHLEGWATYSSLRGEEEKEEAKEC